MEIVNSGAAAERSEWQKRHHLQRNGASKMIKNVEPHVATPEGYLAVMVGEEGEQQERFVVPVKYLDHPRFLQLLKKAEDEYGFDHKGPVAIPYRVSEFHSVRDYIDGDLFSSHRRSCCCGHQHHHHFSLHLRRCETTGSTATTTTVTTATASLAASRVECLAVKAAAAVRFSCRLALAILRF